MQVWLDTVTVVRCGHCFIAMWNVGMGSEHITLGMTVIWTQLRVDEQTAVEDIY